MKADNPVLTLTPNEMQHLRAELVKWLQQAKQKVVMNQLGARPRENYQSIANLEKRTRHAQQDAQGNFRFTLPTEDVWIVEEAIGQKLMPGL
jgi:hypothetical protein